MTSLFRRTTLLASFLFIARASHGFTGTVLDNGALTSGLNAGVDSSERRHDWLSAPGGDFLRMAYPSGQAWGAVFFTVGKPKASPRPSRDYSRFSRLSVELRGAFGGEEVEIGIKDSSDPDNGNEVKESVQLTSDWQTFTFSLSDFDTANLHAVYVVTEFVFGGARAQTVDVRRVDYETAAQGVKLDGTLDGSASTSGPVRNSTPITLAVTVGNHTWSASDPKAGFSVFGTFIEHGSKLTLAADANTLSQLSEYVRAFVGGDRATFGLKNVRAQLKLKGHRTLAVFTLSARLVATRGRFRINASGTLMASE